MKLLHTPDAAEGNDHGQPSNNPPIQPSAPAAPPAGTVVANAPSERERELAAELERAKQEAADAKSDRLAHERTIMDLEDKHERYRKTVEKPTKPAPPKSKWTFFD